jgi:two-component system response regulator NreC
VVAEREHVTLVLADDHVVVRAGLRLILENAGIEVLAEAEDAEGAVRMVRGHKPDVLLLDINMPGDLGALDAIPLALGASPETRVCVLTGETDADIARRALDAGASGYVLKLAENSDVVTAIRQVACGQTYLHPSVGVELAALLSGRGRDEEEMSPREIEVLRLLALGHTNAEMADQLHLSARTVETHRARIMRKLGRRSRAELTRYALERGLLGDGPATT